MIDLDRLAIAVAFAAADANAEIGRRYWSFTREVRGTLAPAAVYERRATARMVLVTLREVAAERAGRAA